MRLRPRLLWSSWKARAGIALLLGLVVASAMALEYQRAAREQEAWTYLLRTNGWIANQVQLELMRFLVAVDDFVVGGRGDRDEVVLRFDLLWSRLPIFLTGPEAAEARAVPGAVETVTALANELEKLAPEVGALKVGDLAARNEIHDHLAPYLGPLHALSMEVSIGSQRRGMLDHLEQLKGREGLIGAMAFGGGFLTIVFLLLEIRRSHRQTEREREARQTAAAASEAKSRFLANMSHELRTPLNAIIGFSEMLLGEHFGPLGSPRYRTYVTDILGSGRHLLSVVNDILDAARIENGALQISEEIFDPREVMQTCLRMLSSLTDDKNISVRTSIEPDLPLLRADQRLFRQVCLNLLGNSIKFSKAGKSVAFSLCQNDGSLVLAVSDEGPGISPAALQHVTTPFFQSDDALNRRHEGSGLGLALVKAFMEAHGGRLEIVSRLGEGTRVSAWFPSERLVNRSEAA